MKTHEDGRVDQVGQGLASAVVVSARMLRAPCARTSRDQHAVAKREGDGRTDVASIHSASRRCRPAVAPNGCGRCERRWTECGADMAAQEDACRAALLGRAY